MGSVCFDARPCIAAPLEVSRNGLLHCTLWLDAGWHWITWVWRYSGLEEQAADGADGQAAGGSGLRLLNVSVTNVQGALGSKRSKRGSQGAQAALRRPVWGVSY